MAEIGYSSVIHLVGLGGAGTNIVESFLKNEKTIDLLKTGVGRLSLMALDIADPDIKSLEETHKNVLEVMKRNGVPQERLSLIAQSIKFPSAEAMFDFVQHKFKEHLTNDGIKVKKYNPWLPSTVAIPPLAGGAGRRRSLAKAIYTLNYYQLGIIKSLINMFKDHALSSITSPIVVIIFGLGGAPAAESSSTSPGTSGHRWAPGSPSSGWAYSPVRATTPPPRVTRGTTRSWSSPRC